MRGAGGSEGGVGRFFIGLVMICAGGYLFLNAIQVNNSFGFGMSMFRMGSFQVTGGMVFVPFIFGVGIIFYNSKNLIGWLLCGASAVMLAFGIITSIDLRLRPMSAFELVTIIVLLVGGIGLFLSSLKSLDVDDPVQR